MLKMNTSAGSEKGYHPVFIVILIILFHFLLFLKNKDAILHQLTLRDFDGYWHLIRAQDLYNFGNFNETILSRSNAPYGESLHWTSSFDLLLFAGAYVASFFVNFNIALLWWSIIVNPLLHVLTVLVLFWSLRDFFGDLRASIFGLIFTFQLYYFGIFDMGVPDHHGAQIFLFSFFIATSVKSIIDNNWNLFFFCGVIGGISIWFGIESIFVVLLTLSFFGFVWIQDGNAYKKQIFIFSFMVAITLLLTILIDTDINDFTKIFYDRRSIVHVFLWFFITLFWFFVLLIGKWSNVFEKKNARIISATIWAVTCILLMYELFPLFFKNPLSDINSLIKLIYLNQTHEFTGLFSENNIHQKISYAYWAMTLPAVPFGIYFAYHKQSKERQVWLFITLINISYIFLSACIYRMIFYAILCSIIPISCAISEFYVFINDKFSRSYYQIIRTVFIVICCFSFIVPGIVFNAKEPDYLINDQKFLARLCQYLNEDTFFEKKPKRILTSIYLGPLLLYKTKNEIIGTPSHRNVSGILDTYDVMNARNAESAHLIIHRRNIQVLLIGRPEYGIGDYFFDIEKKSKKSAEIFHHQLWKGLIPAWLQPYPVPKSLEGKVKIFKVK